MILQRIMGDDRILIQQLYFYLNTGLVSDAIKGGGGSTNEFKASPYDRNPTGACWGLGDSVNIFVSHLHYLEYFWDW